MLYVSLGTISDKLNIWRLLFSCQLSYLPAGVFNGLPQLSTLLALISIVLRPESKQLTIMIVMFHTTFWLRSSTALLLACFRCLNCNDNCIVCYKFRLIFQGTCLTMQLQVFRPLSLRLIFMLTYTTCKILISGSQNKTQWNSLAISTQIT